MIIDGTDRDLQALWANLSPYTVLVLPNDDLPFRLGAYSSGIATGAVLSQQSVDDNAWHPITFLSKALNPVERNYKIHDTEMLAII
jgi:hypothetical protein